MLGKLQLLAMLVAGAVLLSCSVHKETTSTGAAWIAREIAKADLQDHQWGMALFDPKTDEFIYQSKSDEYFTPASNTKILTLYIAGKYLDDTTEALRFVTSGDTLTFWGTGDPSFMYTVADSNRAFEFLRTHEGPLVYAPLPMIEKYGKGWAWDDYAYGFQVERSTFPVYGNRLTFDKLSVSLEGTVRPGYFREYIIEDDLQSTFVTRIPEANSFAINYNEIDEYPFSRSVPFIVSEYDIGAILSDALGKKVDIDYSYSHPDKFLSIKGSSVDSLSKRLMQESDNFIAEQFLVQSGSKLGMSLEPEDVIERAQEEFFAGAPDPFQWYDGSGLSRYNLFTPRSLVWLLDRLYEEQGMEYIKEIFPAGGVSGTIEDWYSGEGTGAYVYAKTGTLRNRHCLSGYVICKSGRVLVFSFMHSNFVGSSSEVKEAMEGILSAIHNKY